MSIAEPEIAFELQESPVPVMRLVDTHAHVHFPQFAGQVDGVLRRALDAGVDRMISVGVNTADSRKAIELAAVYGSVWATVGIHPHDAGEIDQGVGYLRDLASRRKVVAIGECGLDFYRSQSSVEDQERALRTQVELAQELNLPLIFHVREAFERFFAIMKDYGEVRGVMHSFAASRRELEQSLEQGWYVALNGIMTFTKDEEQLAAAKQVPGNRLLLETDCPFLSPAPHRGKTNEPARIADIAEFLAELRGEPVKHLAQSTTLNAETFFGI